MNIELDENEKRLVALALHSLAMRHGPAICDAIKLVARKLGIEHELKKHAQDWVAFSERKKH